MALLLGLTASHFSQSGSMVGLEYWVQFRRPVFADETIRLEWLIIKVSSNARLGGHIFDLRGRIRREDGRTAVGGQGRGIVTDQPSAARGIPPIFLDCRPEARPFRVTDSQ